MKSRVMEEDFVIPKFPLLPLPLIKYETIHNLDCNRDLSVSLPQAIVKMEDAAGGDGPKAPTAGTRLFQSIGAEEASSEPEEVKYKWSSPRLMILCEDGDINCAMHYLMESLHDPFAPNAVATLLLQESMLEEFVNRLEDRLQELRPEIANHPVYLTTLSRVEQLKAETIVSSSKTVPRNASPMMIFDFSHNYFGDGPTGVITLHTFRTIKDALQLQAREPLAFTSVSIWNEKLGAAYELVARLNFEIFLLNCFYVNLDPIGPAFVANMNSAKVSQDYHYESMTFNKKRKVVVHPVATTWGQKAKELQPPQLRSFNVVLL
ncbi:uncharacterized protein LOC117586042 [Drosophila guanche]|uniref:Uncharacterized protein n=1 Tax=Drosophila guanche TaxID=7266 RepID=A0A3B0JT78_DROGU|nr:uncharacterized protein LOC117586042 [Drosophila guanche]SPP84223.1 Hypothetical predicted protein [Drosophila guanche]